MTGHAGLTDRFAATMDRLLPEPPCCMGAAVSGGSDSTALMHLAAAWAAQRGIALHIATIDHGLRAEAAQEAAQVAEQAAALGLPHATLRWAGWSGRGNLQDAARRARRGLLEHWRGGIRDILLGHTMDDQAETVWLNLARGSGVAGLSAMAERHDVAGLEPIPPGDVRGCSPDGPRDGPAILWRPLLGERRAVLRDWLRARSIPWSDDPSNDDPRFDRVRLRRALLAGEVPGVTVPGLAATAQRMQRAGRALALRAGEIATRIARIDRGDVIFDRTGLTATDAETRATLLAHALQWVASQPYRPRATALDRVTADILDGRGATLHGCQLRPGRSGIRIGREASAVELLRVAFDGNTVWDRRWRIRGPARDAEIRALGAAGLARADSLRPDGLPRWSLASRPALWAGDDLIAVPGLDDGPWQAELVPPAGEFHAALDPPDLR